MAVLHRIYCLMNKYLTIHAKCDFKVVLMSHDKIESNTYDPVLLNLLNSLQKRDKMLGSPIFYLFSSIYLINSVIHEHSFLCKLVIDFLLYVFQH